MPLAEMPSLKIMAIVMIISNVTARAIAATIRTGHRTIATIRAGSGIIATIKAGHRIIATIRAGSRIIATIRAGSGIIAITGISGRLTATGKVSVAPDPTMSFTVASVCHPNIATGNMWLVTGAAII
ncbi:MAG: hypothetical protein NVSMB28_24510 [Collimonas sp.]